VKIIELSAENVKRLRAVDITPDEHMQIIGGRNSQGKTSVMDAIWLALTGGVASKAVTRPIRDGEDKASVRLDLGDLVVTRTWVKDKTSLTVASADGAKYSSPQKVLDALIGRLSFDPLEFTRLSARDQSAALLDLVNLDVDLGALATQRSAAYDRRTQIGRDGKALDGQAAGLGNREDAPDTEVSVADLVAQHRDAERIDRTNRVVTTKAMNDADRVVALRLSLKDAEETATVSAGELKALPPVPDIDSIADQIDSAEDTNAAVRRNVERAELAKRIAHAHTEHSKATAAIEAIDKTKADALAGATFPVDGLGFDDDGVTYQGVPFSQASASEQIRVSLAMAMSLNPKLRVIRILDGSLLDAENLAQIADMAKDNDYQVWIERVGTADGIGVVIEDGAVSA